MSTTTAGQHGLAIPRWIAAACALLSACGVEEAPVVFSGTMAVFENVGLDATFTGSAACAACHEEVWQEYQGHAMARSYYALTDETAVEDYLAEPVYDSRSGYWYRAYREGSGFFQEEFRLDSSGLRAHSLAVPMQLVMGSGSAARSYFAYEGRWLRQLPLTWYAQVGRWALSPGYDKVNKRFDRLLPERCMACHNDYPVSVPFTDGKYESVPHGIGCERCHGPGSVHVAARRRDDVTGFDGTIVNPARLDSDRQMDVCQQCHLNTAVSLLRKDRTAFDFRPSQRLDEYLSLFVASSDDRPDEIGVISHADRLKQSRCFVAAKAAGSSMTCTTCHDPHRSFRNEGTEYFDRACRSCHTQESLAGKITGTAQRAVHAAGAACADCHMPFVAAGEAPHASFTDHRIRVVRPEIETESLPAQPALRPYFEKDGAGADADRYGGMASIVLARQRGDSLEYRNGIVRLERYLAGNPNDAEAQFMAGFAWMATGDPARAIPHLETAVRSGPPVPERMTALAESYSAVGRDPATAERLYRDALAVQPALATAWVNLGRLLQSQGRAAEAEASYAQAVREMPWLAEGHYNLGTSRLARGEVEPARRSLDEAIRLDPDYGRALTNRGLLALGEDNRGAAAVFLERAAAASPRDAIVLGNLGAFLVEEGRLDRAITVLRRAVDAQPDHFDALVNLSIALVNADRPAEARPFAERAARLQPDDERVRRILAAL